MGISHPSTGVSPGSVALILNTTCGGSGSGSIANVAPLDLSGVDAATVIAVSHTRRLRAAHTGDIFELVYNGDASTHGIGTDSNYWVDWSAVESAVTGEVNIYVLSQWYDQGSGGNDLAQSTGANRPRYKYGSAGQPNDMSYQWMNGGYPASLFDGTDYLDATVSTSEGSLYGIAVVAAKDWYTLADQGVLGIGYGSTSGIGLLARTSNTVNGWEVQDAVVVGDGYTSGRAPRAFGGADELTVQYGTHVILEWSIVDGGNDVIRLNGQTVATSANTDPVPALTSQTLCVGGLTSSSGRFNGQIAELMLWVGGNTPAAAAKDAIFANVNNVYKTSALTAENWT